jgi:hypothetical protein
MSVASVVQEIVMMRSVIPGSISGPSRSSRARAKSATDVGTLPPAIGSDPGISGAPWGGTPRLHAIPISFWIFSRETPFVSGMTRSTQKSWPTMQAA